MRILITFCVLLLFSTLCQAQIIVGTNTYTSSKDGYTLQYRYYYMTGLSNLPILVAMHGYNGDMDSWTSGQIGDTSVPHALYEFATNGWLCVNVAMRGRDGLAGVQDDSGRELMDIYDAVIDAQNKLAPVANPTNVFGYGTSGGGGNIFGCAVKFPDLFAGFMEQSGMSDYGFDSVNSWYATGPSQYQLSMRQNIGGNSSSGTPANFPDKYETRDANEAIVKNVGTNAYFWMWTSSGDTTVPTNSTTVLIANLTTAGLSNWTYTIEAGNTHDGYDVPHNYNQWSNAFTSYKAWVLPSKGTIGVWGYIVTKQFTVWLGTGLQQVADLTYDVAGDSYSFTSVTTNGINLSLQVGNIIVTTNFTTSAIITTNNGVAINPGTVTFGGNLKLQGNVILQ